MLTSLVLTVLFLLLLGTVLAALLVLAEKTILNYGPCGIDVNAGEKKLTVQGGSSLLSALADNGIFIPSACGGRGSCAYCKVKVLDGGGSIGPVEEPYLSPQEQRSGVRLSCQVKVRSPLRIVVPRELFSVKRYRGVLERKLPLTHDIVELRIRLTEPVAMEFTAGQYVQLQSPEYRGRESVMRAYSISSPPSEKGAIELVIRRVPGGICTTWVFDVLKQGQEVDLSGPYGDFHLSNSTAPAVFIAGGSGMAPVYAILRHMRETADARPASFFFGALRQRDLFYVEELRAIEKAMPSLNFIPALSDEPLLSGWKGERGLITDVLRKNLPDASKHEAYLCGSPGLIDASIRTLTSAGMPKERIFYDKFA